MGLFDRVKKMSNNHSEENDEVERMDQLSPEEEHPLAGAIDVLLSFGGSTIDPQTTERLSKVAERYTENGEINHRGIIDEIKTSLTRLYPDSTELPQMLD